MRRFILLVVLCSLASGCVPPPPVIWVTLPEVRYNLYPDTRIEPSDGRARCYQDGHEIGFAVESDGSLSCGKPKGWVLKNGLYTHPKHKKANEVNNWRPRPVKNSLRAKTLVATLIVSGCAAKPKDNQPCRETETSHSLLQPSEPKVPSLLRVRKDKTVREETIYDRWPIDFFDRDPSGRPLANVDYVCPKGYHVQGAWNYRTGEKTGDVTCLTDVEFKKLWEQFDMYFKDPDYCPDAGYSCGGTK